MDLTRRTFLKGLAGAAAALVLPKSDLMLPAPAPALVAPPPPPPLVVPERRLWPLDSTMLARPAGSAARRLPPGIDEWSFDVQMRTIDVGGFGEHWARPVPIGPTTVRFDIAGDLDALGRYARIKPGDIVTPDAPGMSTLRNAVITAIDSAPSYHGREKVRIRGEAMIAGTIRAQARRPPGVWAGGHPDGFSALRAALARPNKP